MRLLEQDSELRRVALRTPAGFLACGFGSGLSRFAPGTAGTLAAVPLALLFRQLPPSLYWAALAFCLLLGVRVCGTTSRMLGRHDPGNIVWDEMVGFWLTIALVPASWPWWLAGFLLFRLFDILKPWPIRIVERSFGGGLGIMLDDVAAAAYAMLVLAAVRWTLGTLAH